MLTWITDPHLNFIKHPEALGRYIQEENHSTEGVVISGDIGEYESFVRLLREFYKGLCLPIYFVLGNHDAYGGGVILMERRAAQLEPPFYYLQNTGPIELAPGTFMCGVDGWYDARNGQAEPPLILMPDWDIVAEYKVMGWPPWRTSAMLADRAAGFADGVLKEALERGAERILFVTHVPPFAEATWYKEKLSKKDWLPWMSSQVMGDHLLQFAGENPDVSITVLCGHTHYYGQYQAAKNLKVITGSAGMKEYGTPDIAGHIDYETGLVFMQ